MSNIAEQKALEAYPIKIRHAIDVNRQYREGYTKGHDQTMSDFLEKAENFILEKVQDYFWWNSEECFVDFDKEECIKDFKNYMQEESKN